jgi:hypothetical protein
VWGWRASRKWTWGIWTGSVILFASGARWLLLFLPARVVAFASENLALWGSGAQTASTLGSALRSTWAIDGGPAVPLPFAYVNGILQPFVLYVQTGPASMGLIALLLLLILYGARPKPWTWLIFIALLAFWALAAEAGFVLFVLGTVLATPCSSSHRKGAEARRLWHPWCRDRMGSLHAAVDGALPTVVTGGRGYAVEELSWGLSRADRRRSSLHLGELRLKGRGLSVSRDRSGLDPPRWPHGYVRSACRGA